MQLALTERKTIENIKWKLFFCPIYKWNLPISKTQCILLGCLKIIGLFCAISPIFIVVNYFPGILFFIPDLWLFTPRNILVNRYFIVISMHLDTMWKIFPFCCIRFYYDYPCNWRVSMNFFFVSKRSRNKKNKMKAIH